MGTPSKRASGKAAETTRRDFLRASVAAMGALAAARARAAAGTTASGGVALAAGPGWGAAERPRRFDRVGNAMPGRAVLLRDPEMGGHESTIARDLVEHHVHQGVRALLGLEDTAAAFEALFPGLTADSRIAIKVNCIGYTDTRWETVRGVVSGLSLMVDGTYDVSQVTIYDNRDFVDRPSNPFDPDDFTFGGHCPVIEDCRWDYDPEYFVYDDHRLYTNVLEADYLINMPALKSHNRELNQLTLALKNHYGSCFPSDLCNDIEGLLTVNADPAIKDKTVLVLMDGLRGTFHGVPQQPPQVWLSFPEGSPNTLFFSTDPVTNEYWGRETINTERVLRGLEEKPAPWIETASAPPYEIGVSDPDQMKVIFFDPAAAPENTVASAGLSLLPGRPNPFRDRTALRLVLPVAVESDLAIFALDGRRIRQLHRGPLGPGSATFVWDGRDDGGRPQPTGVYWVRLTDGRLERQRAVRLIR